MSSKTKETTKRLLSQIPKHTNAESSIVQLIFKITELFYLEGNRLLRPYNLTLEQSALLTHLYEHDGISQKNLAKHVLKDQANTTRILKRMLEKGFVRRVSPEHDKRQNLIYLTDKGEHLVDQIVPKIYHAQSDVMKVLNDREAEQLKDLLYRFYENISDSFAKYAGKTKQDS